LQKQWAGHRHIIGVHDGKPERRQLRHQDVVQETNGSRTRSGLSRPEGCEHET
jgi:ribosomal protein L35